MGRKNCKYDIEFFSYVVSEINMLMSGVGYENGLN